MRKAIKHVKLWNRWRKNIVASWISKILVLFGVIHSPSLYMMCGFGEITQEEIKAALNQQC